MEENTADINQTQNEMAPHKDMARFGVLAVIVLLVGLGAFLLLMNNNRQAASKEAASVMPTVMVSPTVPVLGSMAAAVQVPVKNKVGVPVPVVINATSGGKNVVGFDILITYDPAQLSLGQITPMNKAFQISSYTKKKGFISVTGTRVTSNNASVLQNSELMKIAFIPLKSGSTKVELNKRVNKETAKFIDTQSQEYIPQLQSLTIEVL